MTTPQTPAWTATPTNGLQLNSVALSPDGTLSLCGTSNEFGTGQFGLYCYNTDGTLAWQQSVTGLDATQGVFWVAISADKRFAAAGGETADDVGFLTICNASDGTILLNEQGLSGRVNQVSFSQDGTLLVAGFADALLLYAMQPDGTFALNSTAAVASNFDCISALLADNGSRAWLAAINYNTKPYTGLVQSVEISGGLFSVVNSFSLSSGAMRIAVTPDGNHAAAALHSGGCALFTPDQPATPVWTYVPSLPNLSLAYAVAITQTSTGNVVVACGSNQTGSESGYLYLVDSVPSNAEIADPPQWMPTLRWSSALQYSANPGVCLDQNATKVTATDGKPTGNGADAAPLPMKVNGTTPESPGNFYLFDGLTGEQRWKYPTPLMNWPMVITPDGSAALGGSDDGTLYYWKLS